MDEWKRRRAELWCVACAGVIAGCAEEVASRTSPRPMTAAPTVALQYVHAHAEALGLGRVEEVRVRRTEADEDAVSHVRVQEHFRGVPVFQGEAIVHVRPDGVVASVTDALVKDIRESLDTRATLGRDEAIAKAVQTYACEACLTSPPEAELMVLRHEGRDHLAYRVQLRREDGTDATAMPVYFIDAHDGAVVWSYDNLQAGTGRSLYSGTVPVNTFLYAGSYYLEDHVRGVSTVDMRTTTDWQYLFTDANDVWDTSSQAAGVDAQWGAAQVYDYYLAVHGRRGLDGNGGPTAYRSVDGNTWTMLSRVHYGRRYNGAFWNGQTVTCGDGDGRARSAAVGLDTLGHEMTHGLTERTAGLTYSGESGALNESWSDVFAALIERRVRGETAGTWTYGEDSYTPRVAGDALRYMATPHSAANQGFTLDDDPDHYSERYTGTADNGGLHFNSGIANKACHLGAMGGTHHGGVSMTGIGPDAAGRIWYLALTGYMTSGTSFAGARVATLAAAAALYGEGSTERNAVASAWTLCGVN